ncbi:hypothetical protein KVF89_11165 [Nocardioides carbamazepini]|uniref:hypothetical protein n=1 Tax=Nocardioides carbamazepini TaxID=2854259 RepID=UPI00214A0994|nr:hypothetical protein [Nocardioides carbamazepini]MCR1783096.1 hypothetical protein [Nocardioides carbamazepini]
MIRRLAALLAAAVLAVGAGAAPAHADDETGLSTDGVTWLPQLTAPLYDAAFRWVPGDVEERSFRVRNDGPSAGELSVEVLATDPAGLLASPDFHLEARVGQGPWTEVLVGTTRIQPTVLGVPRGGDTSVTVRGTFRPEATARFQEVAPFEVRVTMAETGEVAGVEDDGGGGVSGGALPDTGSPFGIGLIWIAAGLVGAGIALVRPGRHRRQEVSVRG